MAGQYTEECYEPSDSMTDSVPSLGLTVRISAEHAAAEDAERGDGKQ